MKVAIMMAAWMRPSLTEIVLKYYSTLKVDGIDFSFHIAISPEDEHAEALTKSANRYGFRILDIPNRPLCDKLNGLLMYSSFRYPDVIITLGSDDLLNASMVTQLVGALAQDDSATPTAVHFYDIPSNRVIRRNMYQNGIRSFTREFVLKMGWQLWRDQPHALAMDKALDMRIRGHGTEFSLPYDTDAVVLDIKDGVTSRIPFRAYDTNLRGDEVEVKPFFETHFPGVYGQLRHLR